MDIKKEFQNNQKNIFLQTTGKMKKELCYEFIMG